MDEFASAEQALAIVHQVVQPISPDDLHRPTPCRDWDVETLAEHLVDTVSRLGAAAGIEPDRDLPALDLGPVAEQLDHLGHRRDLSRKPHGFGLQDGAAAD